MRTEATIKEAERLMENLRDDAEAIREEASKACGVLKSLRMNEQVRNAKGIEIGDFFRDRSGDVGVFCGCWGQNMWGRYLNTRHYGYVYPSVKLTHEEAITAIFNSMHNDKVSGG